VVFRVFPHRAPAGSESTKRHAAARATAPTTFGVPPSCRAGTAAQSVASRRTRRTRRRSPGTAVRRPASRQGVPRA